MLTMWDGILNTHRLLRGRLFLKIKARVTNDFAQGLVSVTMPNLTLVEMQIRISMLERNVKTQMTADYNSKGTNFIR